MIADVTSAAKVANAAPVTPILNVNIKSGSNIAFIKLEKREIFKGVTVSMAPEHVHCKNIKLPLKTIDAKDK
jgi:hypothetical protein